MEMTAAMPVRLALGPILFNWEEAQIKAFYAAIAEASCFDRIYLGEVVCGKRMPFSDHLWPDIAADLQSRGKEVVFSTLALPATPRDRRAIAGVAALEGLIEINDLSALAERAGAPFAVGPFVNIYNEDAARVLVARGATSICLPVELSLDRVARIAAACPDTAFEIFAFGRLPLALSGRCYHARVHGLHKDSCQFICARDPDGLDALTLDRQPFLAVNGIQTLSHGVQVYCPDRAEANANGIRWLRLSPHAIDMVAVGEIFQERLGGRASAADAIAALQAMALPGPLIDGYVHATAGAAPVRAQ